MDYPLEQLDPERFQQFAQALLVREFPNVQCFPVAQPDGGRDALSYYAIETSADAERPFLVFQVKFVRQPEAVHEPHRWLANIIAEEAPKIARLVPKGAQEFLLITNVRGTAHLDVGAVDTVTALLREKIPVPAQCWWRDDIDRRLDDAWDIKWAYPELMTGPDLLRAVIETSAAEGRERRAAAIRAFIAHQYNAESEVKFRQVELQNKLLDLFVDVPIGAPQYGGGRRDQFRAQRAFELIMHAATLAKAQHPVSATASADRERESIGGATLLLNDIAQQTFRKLVLEGAPGQGKSTITQYVCQVHRMRLLEPDEARLALPAHHAGAPRRLPLKVDLRDLAAWVSGRNPFTPEGGAAVSPRTLEAFLASMISYQSGGSDFSVSDLHAIGKQSALLVVFDGLDEVADIARRRDVVDEVLAGVHRLEANCTSLQVVVTSRPAAFANSPGMPSDKFVYFHLGVVGRAEITEYTDKWIRARRLSSKEGAEVRQILREKLDQPHLRDLARNPMQLAILLSLIHTRGSSLPDKRTSLYDSYVDLFFSREAEKSAVVRKNRELLINIHRYLAWLLHTASERGLDSGAIEEKRLKEVLDEYLRHEEHDPTLVNELFTGMIERVVALVSRVQGTFEFEVQPLREYFAARFLYETAPYSPPGNPKKGTKPDRFDAIARNFYWLNVTRFYAGCYSKGELPSLIDRINELAVDPLFSMTSHPPLLAATLLADYVFTQHPKSVREVVKIILSGLGLRYVLSSSRRQVDASTALVLPDECGRRDLIAHALSILKGHVPLDYALDLIDLIKANATVSEIHTLWRQALPTVADKTRWLDYGRLFGILHLLSTDQLTRLAQTGDAHARRVIIFKARQFRHFDVTEREFSRGVHLVLNGDVAVSQGRRAEHLLESFSSALLPSRYSGAAVSHFANLTVRDIWGRNNRVSALDAAVLSEELIYPEAKGCRAVVAAAAAVASLPAEDWLASLDPWSVIVESGRHQFGDQWAFLTLANVSAGIKSSTEKSPDGHDLFDAATPLCSRLRYARLKAGQPDWWLRHFNLVSSPVEEHIAILTAMTWVGPATLRRVLPALQDHVGRLSESDWQRLFLAFRRSLDSAIRESPLRPRVRYADFAGTVLSHRVAAMLFERTRAENLFIDTIAPYDGPDQELAELQQEWAIEILALRHGNWTAALDVVSRAYRRGALSRRYAYPNFVRRNRDLLPIDIARDVARNAELYPAYVVALAQDVCRADVATSIMPVGQIAEDEAWFGTDGLTH